jgi:hypothetical protein
MLKVWWMDICMHGEMDAYRNTRSYKKTRFKYFPHILKHIIDLNLKASIGADLSLLGIIPASHIFCLIPREKSSCCKQII